MARHTRERTSRLVAILATGLVTAGPLLLAAGPVVAAPPRIEFSRDGLELLSCNSTPSDRDLTVPAGSTVIFVNELREDATLRIDGRDATRLRDDGSAEVLFHRGTVRVELVPDCGLSLSSDFDEVSVTVVESGNRPSRPPSSTPDRSRVPSAAATSGGPESPGPDRPETDRPDASASPDESASASAAPAGESASPSDAGSAEGTADGDDQGVAAETVSADATSGDDGPNGLLAILAVVCVVGVSAGAIRAIVAQRASRTRVA